jgi:nucleoside-triphosphatase THEP1
MTIKQLLSSKRLWIAFLVFIGLINLKTAPEAITLFILVIAGFAYRKAIRPLLNYKFWIAIALLIVFVPMFAGVKDNVFLGIGYSSDKLAQTFLMVLRGISVFLFIQVLITDLDSNKVENFLHRLGIKHFSELLDISQSILPNVNRIARDLSTSFKVSIKNGLNLKKIYRIIVEVFTELIRLSNRFDAKSVTFLNSDPEELIESLQNEKRPMLIVVTGASGAGKSSWIVNLIKILDSHSIDRKGVVTVKEFTDDSNNEQILVNIADNEKRHLSSTSPFDTHIRTKRYFFHEDTLQWGMEVIKNGFQSEWLIIDELGVLEQEATGFGPAIQCIPKSYNGILLIVLRKSLLDKLETMLQVHYPAISRWQRYFIKIK